MGEGGRETRALLASAGHTQGPLIGRQGACGWRRPGRAAWVISEDPEEYLWQPLKWQ